MKTLTLFQLQALLAKRSLRDANGAAQPCTYCYSAFSTDTTHFPAITASPLHTSPSSCYPFLRLLLHSQPLTTSSCSSTTFIVEYKNPSPRMPSWDRRPSGITQMTSQDTTLTVEILTATAHPGKDSLTRLSKHHRTLQVNNNPPFTFSWGLPGQPSPLSSSLHGCCKLPDRCLAAWSTSLSWRRIEEGNKSGCGVSELL